MKGTLVAIIMAAIVGGAAVHFGGAYLERRALNQAGAEAAAREAAKSPELRRAERDRFEQYQEALSACVMEARQKHGSAYSYELDCAHIKPPL